MSSSIRRGIRPHLPGLAVCAALLLLAVHPAGAQVSHNVELLGHLDEHTYYSDIWGYRAPDGTELALIMTRDGTSVIDATDPTAPYEVAHFTSGDATCCRDVKTYGTHAYAISEGGGGLQIIDLSDPLAPVHVANDSSFFQTCHNVQIDTDTGILYAVGTNDGMKILDLTGDPESPTLVRTFNDYYVHDVYVRDGIAYVGAIFEGFLSILDVSALPTITELSTTFTPDVFCHNTWLTEDSRYCFTTDEVSAGHIGVYDVQDLMNPVLVTQWFNPDEPASIVHNVHVKGDFAYVSWYVSGLHILDVRDPVNPIRAGWYDTFTTSGSGFNGAWGVYPYQPSGVVYVSDMATGFYAFSFSTSILEGTVAEAPADAPIEGATVRTLDGSKTTTSAADGTYLLYVDAGVQDFVYERFGYESDTVTVDVPEGGGVIQDVELVKFPDGSLAGSVHELTGGVPGLPLGGVTITVAGTPLVTMTGGPGNYSFPSLPEGDYTVVAQKSGYGPVTGSARIRQNATTTKDFNLQAAAFADNFEADLGWTIGAPDDDATQGIWRRADPVGTGGGTIQPEDDHTPAPGVQCYVTGNGFPGGGGGAADVDDGKTTLLSPIFDLSASTDPVLRYYRWYSNDAGPNPAEDDFIVDVSANGGLSWVNLETLSETRNFWEEMTFHLNAYIPLTNGVQLRFVAQDYLGPSWVEAAIDDIDIFEDPLAVSSVGGETPATERPALFLAGRPNPFHEWTDLSFRMEGKGFAHLDIFDVQGRRVRRLVSGELPAGVHQARWDGERDDESAAGPGLYFARLTMPGRTLTEKLLLTR